MNNKYLLAIAAVVALPVGVGAYYLGKTQSATSGPTESKSVDPVTGKEVLYWHDPMVPGQRFGKPGKSPFMDMQLVPVYADEAAIEGSVVIDPRVQQRLGVRTAPVDKRKLQTRVTAAGNVEYNERDVVVVQARANGYLERVYARTPLQSVKAGQVLADMYVPDWVAAQEDYLAIARMQSPDAASLRQAAMQRMRLAGMTDEQIAAVAERNEVQPRIAIRAPMPGVVSELMAREGMTVMNGAPLFRINGLDHVWLYAEIPEAQLRYVQRGASVIGTTVALPGEEIAGSVLDMLPELTPDTRTAKARIELRNPNHRLLPGMFVTVTVAMPESDSVLAVPSEAVIVTGTRSVVIVAEGEGRFRPVTVNTGRQVDDYIEIVDGVNEGDIVVTSAQFLIDSEASLKAATERMTEASSKEMTDERPSPELRSTSPGTGRGEQLPLPVPGEGGGEGHDHGDHK